MSAVRVDARCTGCGACLATCPERALLPAPSHPLVVEPRCTACLACVEVCPADAIAETADTPAVASTPASPAEATSGGEAPA